MATKVRPALSNREIEEMGKKAPDAPGRYLAARREELAAQQAEERRAKQDADSLGRFTQAFVNAGGDHEDAEGAFYAERTLRASEAAASQEDRALASTRRRMYDAL